MTLQWADEQLVDIHQGFSTRVEERTKDAHERLEVLKSRIDTLEEVRHPILTCTGFWCLT